MARCATLLDMGADVDGCPAHEQLTRLVQQFITVRAGRRLDSCRELGVVETSAVRDMS